jgi:hypothetical protein
VCPACIAGDGSKIEAAMQAAAAQSNSDRTTPRFTHQQILRVLSGILLCIFLAAIDQTVVIPAVPAIAADLNGFGHLAWIISAYLLTSTAMTPIYGKLSDIYGRRKLLLVGLAIFAIASVLCALAGSLDPTGRRPGVAGDRRGRADGHGAGGDRRRGQPARARPLEGLHGLDLGHRLDRRADHRRLGHRYTPTLRKSG